MTCRGSQKSHNEERRLNYPELLERGGKEVYNDGQGSDYDPQSRGKTDNWDESGARGAQEWNSESSDSDLFSTPRFDDNEDSDAIEYYDPREYRGERKLNKVTPFHGSKNAKHPSHVLSALLVPPKNGVKVGKTLWLY